MVSQKQIRALNIKFSEIKEKALNIKNSVGELISADKGVEKIYIRTLFDVDGYDSLSDLFVSGFCSNINKNIKFEYLPISKSIEIDAPLMLISDDAEIDNETACRLQKRKKVNAPTFPVIIFSNDFFVLREGESLAYIGICNSLSQYSELPIMPLRKQDFFDMPDFVALYVNCVADIVYLFLMKKNLDELYENLFSEFEEMYKIYEASSCPKDIDSLIEKIATNNYLRALSRICEELKKCCEDISSYLNECDGFINTLHEEYDRHIYDIVTHKNTEGNSAFAVRLNLEYGILNNNLKKLCSEAEREFGCYELKNSLKDITYETRAAIDSNVADISFIGTFSSGKTTLINALLGHKHKLRTSVTHNTAVLMELFSAQDKEYYEIVYKKELKWDMIRFNSFSNKNIINSFDCNAKIMNITNHPAGGWIISYKSVCSGEVRTIDIGRNHKLAVDRGSLIGPGGSFVEQDIDKTVFKICSKGELAYIGRLMSGNDVSGIHIDCNAGSIRSREKIRWLIRQLQPVYKNIESSSSQPTISVEELKSILGNQFNDYNNVTFGCTLSGFKTKKYELDEAGWIRFMGAQDSKEKPFSESPECYMPTQKIKVYLKSDFLKYCSITDTPGFGSITDEHDAITERYLRDSNGKLIVMITIDLHILDTKSYDLLYKISEIFKNSRRNQMKDICFVLNCFTNRSVLEQCKKNVKKVCNHIRKLGFTENEVYVDNLKQVLDSNTDKRSFIEPYPAYYSFKTDCLDKFLKDSINRKYANIRRKWENFFSENSNWIENQIDGFQSNLNDTEKRIGELNSMKKQIELLQPESEEYILKEVREVFDEFYDAFEGAFRGNRKGIFQHHRLNAVMEVLDNFKADILSREDDEEELTERIEQSFRRLSYFAKEYKDSQNENMDMKVGNRLIVATFEKIRSILNDADDNTHFFNKNKQTNYYMSQLRDIMNQDKEQSCSNIRGYFNRYKQKFDNEKNFILRQIQNELSKSTDKDAIENDLRKYNELHNTLIRFKKGHFDVISFKT